MIADAIKEQYPELSMVTVDMATIRASDRKHGLRYTYLTPATAQHVLLAFDQGWPQPVDHLTVKRAVQIVPICRPKTGPVSPAAIAERRAEKLAEYEERIANGEELSRGEKAAVTRLRNPKPAPERPSSTGRARVNAGHDGLVVSGGRPRVVGAAHPNLLRGRNRHYGAQMADPGVAFREAVDAAVAKRMAEQESEER